MRSAATTPPSPRTVSIVACPVCGRMVAATPAVGFASVLGEFVPTAFVQVREHAMPKGVWMRCVGSEVVVKQNSQ